MSHVPRPRFVVRRPAFAIAATLALVAIGGLVPVTPPVVVADVVDDARYIVQLVDQPLAGLGNSAESFESRQAISADARLQRAQRSAAHSVGAEIDQSFTTVLNGFSATLSVDQVTDLSARSDVLSVSRERVFTLDVETSADALGLAGPTGVWQDLGGAEDAGAGVVVGMIDSGIAPENPVFAGTRLASTTSDPTIPHLDGNAVRMEKSDGGTFLGACESSATFASSACSTKIVGARVFTDGPASGTIFVDKSTEYFSPRDASGHGSHTSAIAAGNVDVAATTAGVGPVAISGVAPAAKIAVYKACWLDAFFGTGRCSETDLVAAIDAAVRDGVDVINYSIGSGSGDASVDGPVDLALLRAASAGVFVAASAGNSGPDASTVDHTEPWVTTVAASTTQRGATVVVAGTEYAGVSSTVYGLATTDAPLVQDRSNPASLYCRAGSLDATIVQDAVVLCLRSSSDTAAIRLAASAEVLRAGGVGMILANTTTSAATVVAEAHSVPTIHVNADSGSAIAARAAAGATASFLPVAPSGTAAFDPAIADFSSRGPALTGYANVLKPDLAAPGVQVLSASTNAPGARAAFRILSGTSMASPQVAGLAALALSTNPSASPASIRSALMTTAKAAVGTTDPFAEGAGIVLPSAFLEPGFVYDADADDWNGYLNGLGVETGTRAAPVHGSDLNQASLAVGSLVGTRTVKRTVTSTGAGTFTATTDVPGIDVSVAPARLVFTRAGQQATFTITASAADADLDEFASGTITWRGTTTSVRSGIDRAIVSTFPIAVRPVATSSEPPLAELPTLPETDPPTSPSPSPEPSPDPDPVPPIPGGDPDPQPQPENDTDAQPQESSPATEGATTEASATVDQPGSDTDVPEISGPTGPEVTVSAPPASAATPAPTPEPRASGARADVAPTLLLPLIIGIIVALLLAAGLILLRLRTVRQRASSED